MIKVIILDFDGVVVESVDIKNEAWENLLPEYPEHKEEILKYHYNNFAVNRFVKFKYIVENILKQKYDEKYKNKLADRFVKYTRERIISCPYVEGAKDFLEYFVKKIPLYIASTTPIEELKIILNTRNLTKYFKGIYGAPGLKPDMFDEILRIENVSYEKTIFIGDSLEDYIASSAKKIYFIGRVNKFDFDKIDIPKYNDLTSIKKHLTEKMLIA